MTNTNNTNIEMSNDLKDLFNCLLKESEVTL